MFKYILIVQIFLGGLFAHGGSESHAHFFSSLHVDGLIVFFAVVILGFVLFKQFTKEAS